MARVHDAEDKRRTELINKLIMYNVYKRDEKQLFELTLKELEDEYTVLQGDDHPHCNMGSIHWKNRSKVNS